MTAGGILLSSAGLKLNAEFKAQIKAWEYINR